MPLLKVKMIIAAATALVFISCFSQGYNSADLQKIALAACGQNNIATVSSFNFTCTNTQVTE